MPPLCFQYNNDGFVRPINFILKHTSFLSFCHRYITEWLQLLTKGEGLSSIPILELAAFFAFDFTEIKYDFLFKSTSTFALLLSLERNLSMVAVHLLEVCVTVEFPFSDSSRCSLANVDKSHSYSYGDKPITLSLSSKWPAITLSVVIFPNEWECDIR